MTRRRATMSVRKRIKSFCSKLGGLTAGWRILKALSDWRRLAVALLLTAVFTPLGLALTEQPPPNPPGMYVFYGPEDFVREAGAPVTVSRAFSVQNTGADYFIRVYNGGRAQQFYKVTSAVVRLNGTE